MSEQQREQVRRFIADQVGITGGAHLDYLTDPHSSTFTLIGMLSCLLAWLTKGRQA